jgi:5'-nucleotidase
VAVKRELPKLRREGAELVVVLSHLGLGGDKHLATVVDGIDIIVGGHSHNRMEQAERVSNTLIVQAGAHGSDLGRFDLTIEDGKITHHDHSLIALTHDSHPPDVEVARDIDRMVAPFAAKLNERIGTAAGWLVRAQTIAGQEARKRDEESPADSLFADIVREELAGDISFLPGVGYGVPIPPGPITAAQLRQLVPHEGKLVTMLLSGLKVREVLERAIENVFTGDPKTKVGGMIQVSGLQFRYDPRQKRGSRVIRVDIGDRRLKNEATYRVVTNTMLASGGHNQQTLKRAKNLQEHGSQYETIKEWFRRHSPIEAPKLGRILAEKNSVGAGKNATQSVGETTL